MQFSDTSTKTGLIQDCEQRLFNSYGDISSNTNRLYEFTNRINRALDKTVTKILGFDGKWQFDDSNYTDIPIGTTNLVSGQNDYTLSVTHLEILEVLCVNAAGETKVLKPVDERDPESKTLLENPSDTGDVTHYDKKGSSLILYPTPNYSATSGLTVRFLRGPSYFTYNDTTKTPGFASIFHPYVSLCASLEYAIDKQHPQANSLSVLARDMEVEMQRFYGRRARDEKRNLSPKIEDTK